MNTLTHMYPRSGTVAFATAPKYASPLLVELPAQALGRDSTGAEFIYRRGAGTRCLHRLSWDNASEDTVTDLLRFHQVAQGCRHSFIWIDHLGGEHAAWFPREQIAWKQTGPDRYSISIGLEETIGLALIDENGQTLLDENGNVITW